MRVSAATAAGLLIIAGSIAWGFYHHWIIGLMAVWYWGFCFIEVLEEK